jgi:cobalamin-dependent methionine synthase I
MFIWISGVSEPGRSDEALRDFDPGDIGVTLTDTFQIEPEQSTSAIVVHHPAAKYFVA